MLTPLLFVPVVGVARSRNCPTAVGAFGQRDLANVRCLKFRGRFGVLRMIVYRAQARPAVDTQVTT